MAASEITTFHMERMRFELLDIAKDKKRHSLRDLEQILADKVQIPQSARLEKKSGSETKLLDRIRWCRLDLKKAKLIIDPQIGYYKITQEGLQFLDNHSGSSITEDDLLAISAFAEWRREIERRKTKRRRSKSGQRQGIVIMIDALGTKANYQSNRSDKKQWKKFVEDLKQKIKKSVRKGVQPYVVSDTIIIAIKSTDISQTLLKISPALEWAVTKSMRIERPIRGCVAAGEIYTDSVQVTGMPVIEAAGYYEKAQWIGISACPSVHTIIEGMSENIQHKHFCKFDLPLRDYIEFDAWAVNWTRRVKSGDPVHDILYSELKTPDLSIALKWRNTRKFFSHAKSRSRPL